VAWADYLTHPACGHATVTTSRASPSRGWWLPRWGQRTPGSQRRSPAFDVQIYRRRNVVEPYFARLKHYPAIATRYDTTARSYQGMIDLAILLIWH